MILFITDLHFASATPSSRIDDYFSSLLKKFVYMLKVAFNNENILILGGDVFQTPSQPDYVKNAIIKAIVNSGVKVYSITGNHDLLYYNMEFLSKTSLGLLYEAGIITQLTEIPTILPNDWVLLGHEPGEPFPEAEHDKSIIITHSFLGDKYNDRLVVSNEIISKSKARFVCMGHDHNQYPVRNLNGTLVIRPGALSRGSSATENKIRTISYAALDLKRGTIGYVPVNIVKDFNDVFKTKFSPKGKETVSFDDIRDFIDKLNKSDVSVNPYDLLIEMEMPDEVYNKCVYYLESVGLIKHSMISED